MTSSSLASSYIDPSVGEEAEVVGYETSDEDLLSTE
jgi:hypothetical protein